MTFLNAILDIVFPTKCLSCGAAGSVLCIKCLSSAPVAEEETRRETAEWIFPIYDYRHPPLKRALWLLKYKGKKRVSSVFAEILYGRILEELADLSVMENFHDSVLIPIPLSKARMRERGFNQAELICKELMKLDGGMNFNLETSILIKPKETVHQAHIENRSERLRNIVGSFATKNESEESKIKNRNIILIDDITTTGATLSEAKKVLEKYGAGKVIAFTVAH